MTKLNLGCGIKKKAGFVNVDSHTYCEPDLLLDLAKNGWPWQDSSVDEVFFECSLEFMGESKEELFHIIKELYRVCSNDAKINITFLHPRHDRFVLNPMTVHRLSPVFFSWLSVGGNLQQIMVGEGDTCLGMMLDVDFSMSGVRFNIAPEFKEEVESGKVSEIELRKRMHFENNICQTVELILTVIKRDKNCVQNC